MRNAMNLVRALQSTVRHNGPRPALLDADQTFTWEDFGTRVARMAGALRASGIAPNERFAVLSRNGFRVEELKWAGLWLGAVPVMINWRLAPPEIAQILGDAGCARLFVENPFREVLGHPALAGWSDKATVFGEASGEDALVYERMLANAEPIPPSDPDPDADALLFYTGGTTGRSKGVRLSHANILANALAFGLGVGARRHDVYLHAAPMFHSADLIAMSWFLQGAPQCYLPAFSPQGFLAAIARHRVGAVVTVPTMLIATVSDPKFSVADLSSLRVLIYGAAPMAADWIERVGAAFPHVDFFNCYGLTETAPDLTIFDARDFRAAIDRARATGQRNGPLLSVGKPNVLNQLGVVAPDGTLLPAGSVGEIVARGPNISQGYLNLPQETCDAWRDGWFHTGDVGYVDAAGYVYLLDRLKDVVISGGENVYSSEVEEVLHRHPAVAEAAIIGVPDELLGETVTAVIVLRAGAQASDEELARHCREHLGGFKVPRRFTVVDALPKSALGKVLKAAMRQQYSATAPMPAQAGPRPRPAA